MDVPLRVLFIIAGLTGIHSIRVSEVSVEAGGSISIPCLYLPQYTNHVKYLCKGYHWSSCTYEVKTDQKNSTKFSISDNKLLNIFTVTVNELTIGDLDYWCAVEINRRADVKNYFHLSVTTGTRSLYVANQQTPAFQGGDVTIDCYHRNPGEMSWCRMGGSCVTTSGSMDGTWVTINTSVPNVFSVTMRGLRTESSGWYLCVSGKLQFPVHLTVTDQPTTTGATPTTVQEGPNRNASFGLMQTLIISSVLIFAFMAALFFWFMLTRHKQNKSASSAKNEAEEEVTYCVVKPTRNLSSQVIHDCRGDHKSYTIHNNKAAEEVTYSVVKPTRKPLRQVVAEDENVTYSTLALR
ncbi:polymeric immunoglobulin receptor-like isoform 2-T2 [Spinachia spinachia]